jgi:hypothetical protein
VPSQLLDPPAAARRAATPPAGRRSATDDLPVETPARPRHRLRRGGPRTPFPLLPLIAVGAGIAIAYVAQTAHVTKATYQLTQLQAQQSQLRQEDTLLGEQLDQLTSAARIDAAAQRLGLRPPARWAYVPAPSPVALALPQGVGSAPRGNSSDPLQKLVAIIRGEFGPAEADAASP